MAKAKRVTSITGKEIGYRIDCPGCKSSHVIYVGEWSRRDGSKSNGWQFNGDVDAPTFNPSLLVYEAKWPDTGEIAHPRCHSFIRDGKIQFLNDCGHPLAGQTVELPEIKDPD